MKVTFLNAFKAIPARTVLTATDCGVYSANGVTLTADNINALVGLGVCKVEVIPELPKFAPKFNTQEWTKVVTAMNADKDSYLLGGAYEFYNADEQVWKESKLLNTASHIGRIASGFAVPAGSSDKKKFNRLEKLNVVFGLGLSRADVSRATGFTVRAR